MLTAGRSRRAGAATRSASPTQIAGRTYIPRENPNYRPTGIASWYGADFHGRKTANGEIYDMNSLSAAHPTLPLPSYVRVTNLHNRRSLVVRVNDRGPFHANRVIDLSKRAAHTLGLHQRGLARVRVEYVGRASLAGSDDRKLMATLRNGAPAPAPRTMVADASQAVPQPRAQARAESQAPSRSARQREVQVASAGSFRPEYFDPRPMTGAEKRAAPEPRRSAPQPDIARTPLLPPQRSAARPQHSPEPAYRVASAESRPAPAPAERTGPKMVWNQGAQPVSFNSRFGASPRPQPVSHGPVSAYAPARRTAA